MHEAFDYYARTFNEPSRGLLGVQVLPTTVVSAHPLIDEALPLNQDDLILSMHRNGRVTIEREPADGNPHYPLDGLPAYSYREALVVAHEEQRRVREAATSARPFAPPSGPVVLSDIDSDEEVHYGNFHTAAHTTQCSNSLVSHPIDIDSDEDQYDFAGDLASLTPAEYEELGAIEEALTASQQEADYNEEEAIERALTTSLSQQ